MCEACLGQLPWKIVIGLEMLIALIGFKICLDFRFSFFTVQLDFLVSLLSTSLTMMRRK